jgi:hypothetical protein
MAVLISDAKRKALAKVETKSEAARQDEAITALLRAPRVEAAAALAGIPEGTLRQWLKDPRFDARYQAARQATLDDRIARLEQLAGDAVDALARNLTCGVPQVEVEAAKAILNHALVASAEAQTESGRRKPAATSTSRAP